MKVLEFKKKKPSVEEAQRRLENLFSEFVERGCDQEFLALLFFTFSVTEVFNHATTTKEGLKKIDDILYSSFGVEKQIIFTPELPPEFDE